MKVGISTASLFTRYVTEDALAFLSEHSVPVAEIFLESFCEYSKEFGCLLKEKKGNTEIHSVHTLTTQFEPTLYSVNQRAREDSYCFLKDMCECAKEVGAKYYTFHGSARFKKNQGKIDCERIGKLTQEIINFISPYGLTLAYENVHWCNYNYVGFFKEIKKYTDGLKGTFDIKQARQSGFEYKDYIKEMGADIVTAHLSDVKDGKMCLPGKGETDYEELFKMLKDVGFNGSMLIEAYTSDYKNEQELFDSLDYLNEKVEKIFG